MKILLWIVSAVIAIAIVGFFYQGGPLAVAANLGSSFTLCLVVAAVLLPVRGILALIMARKSSPSAIGKSDKKQEAEPLPDGIAFRGVENTDGNRYEVHTGTNRDIALAFLREKEIKEERRYVIVETPEGNLGKDLVMIFEEKTSEMIEFGQRKPLPLLEKSMTHCARCGYVVLPAGQSVAGATELIVMEDLKKSGVGFSCQKCRTLWCPFCISFIRGSKPFCGICGNTAEVFRG